MWGCVSDQTVIMWRFFNTLQILHTHTRSHTLWHCAAVCGCRASGEKWWTDRSPSTVGSSAPALAQLTSAVCTHSQCWQVTLKPPPPPPNTHTHLQQACIILHLSTSSSSWLQITHRHAGWEVRGGWWERAEGIGMPQLPQHHTCVHTHTHCPVVSWLWKAEADHSLWLSTNWSLASRLESRHAALSCSSTSQHPPPPRTCPHSAV